ncbi:hypothetical protein ABK040_007673 [Willaertia magna]
MQQNPPQISQDIPTTELIKEVDPFNNNNKFLIPTKKTNNTHSSNDFEIYLSGTSKRGGLMVGKSNNQHDYTKEAVPLPYFIKFTRETIPIPLQNDEYVEFISCGLQHLVIATNFSKCYLFGDYVYYSGGITTTNFIFCHPLQFKVNDNTLHCKITHFDSGEQYVILKDELNRFWYSGKFAFGCGEDEGYYEFLQLQLGELLDELKINKQITKMVAGGRHAAVCVDDKFIYCIGNNFCNQLGIPQIVANNEDDVQKKTEDFHFVKAQWNLNERYQVKELACSGFYTIILTKCGLLFTTKENGQIQLITDTVEKPLTIGTDCELFNNLNLNELKLSSGTGFMNDIHALYNENIVKFNATDVFKKVTIELKPKLPVVHVKISGEINLVYCCKNKTSTMPKKLFKTNGLYDIGIVF